MIFYVNYDSTKITSDEKHISGLTIKQKTKPSSLTVTFKLLGSEVNLMLKKSECLTDQSNVHMQMQFQESSSSDLT